MNKVLLNKWRKKLNVNPIWEIDMIIEKSSFEGCIKDDSPRWAATISFDPSATEETLVHELLELQLYEIGDITFNILENLVTDEQTREILYDQYSDARNRFIESILPCIMEKK